MSDSYKNNWCPDVYRSVFVDRFNDTDVLVSPCCQARPQLEPVDQFNFETSPYLTELRQQFAKGQKPDACHRCWKIEEVGQRSRRQNIIESLDSTEPDYTVRLENIDHSSTWACNLACIMCSPKYSSTWASEQNLTSEQLVTLGRRYQKNNTWFAKLDTSSVKKLHFNGGEPLLNNDHAVLLEELNCTQQLKNVTISYNSNGTQWPSDKVINLWSSAKLVKIYFSIDAIGPAFDYIRWPANWHQVEQNILKMKQELPSNVMFGINATVGGYNIFEIADVCDWFQQNLSTNREGDPSDFAWQIAYNYDISQLSQKVKDDAVVILNNIPMLKGLDQYIKNTEDFSTTPEWFNDLNKLDQKRNLNWQEVLKISKYYRV